jgi:hypothetical protein
VCTATSDLFFFKQKAWEWKGVKFNLFEFLQALFFLQVWKLEEPLRDAQGMNFSSQVPDSGATLGAQCVLDAKVKLSSSLWSIQPHSSKMSG